VRALARLGTSALFLVTGCFSYTVDLPQTPPVDARAAVRPDAAEVCVVRTSLAGGTHVVRDNGRIVGATGGKGYFCYEARPGLHRVVSVVGEERATLDLALTGGERVFLQQSYDGEKAALARLPEREARAAMGPLHYERLIAAPEPVLAPSELAAAAADLPESPPPPPPSSSERRRVTGLTYGIDAGLGLGSARTTPATAATASFAALGSLWAGLSASDVAVIAVRVDGSLVAGSGVADVVLHLALFPAADRAGRAHDFMIFADGGVCPPAAGAPIEGVGRLGFGWEPWRLGPVVVGPFLAGQIARGGGDADAAVIAGMGASLYPKAPAR
jgi:hypothetical protein